MTRNTLAVSNADDLLKHRTGVLICRLGQSASSREHNEHRDSKCLSMLIFLRIVA